MPDVGFMYNPFGADTLRAVIGNLHRSLQAEPQLLLVVYFNPVHSDVLDQCPTLRRIGGDRWFLL